MKNMQAVSLEAVHTHTHTQMILKKKRGVSYDTSF